MSVRRNVDCSYWRDGFHMTYTQDLAAVVVTKLLWASFSFVFGWFWLLLVYKGTEFLRIQIIYNIPLPPLDVATTNYASYLLSLVRIQVVRVIHEEHWALPTDSRYG